MLNSKLNINQEYKINDFLGKIMETNDNVKVVLIKDRFDDYDGANFKFKITNNLDDVINYLNKEIDSINYLDADEPLIGSNMRIVESNCRYERIYDIYKIDENEFEQIAKKVIRGPRGGPRDLSRGPPIN